VDRKAENELWGSVFARLVRIAYPWTRKNLPDAEDLAQEAIADILAESPERPTDVEDIVVRASKIMRGHFLNRYRADRRRRRESWMARVARKLSGLKRTPEDLAASRQHKTRLLARLEQDLKSDPLALRVVQATANDCTTPADQAEALGKDIEEIRKARRRVARAVNAIAATEGGEDLAPEWDIDGGRAYAPDNDD
jgi:hypothetical protein